MLKKIALTVIFLQGIFSSQLFAGTTSGILQVLALDNGAPDVLFISIAGTKDSQPACQTNGSWAYVLPLVNDQNKKIYAMLLAARVSQTPVTLPGSGACDDYPGIETLHAVYY